MVFRSPDVTPAVNLPLNSGRLVQGATSVKKILPDYLFGIAAGNSPFGRVVRQDRAVRVKLNRSERQLINV